MMNKCNATALQTAKRAMQVGRWQQRNAHCRVTCDSCPAYAVFCKPHYSTAAPAAPPCWEYPSGKSYLRGKVSSGVFLTGVFYVQFDCTLPQLTNILMQVPRVLHEQPSFSQVLFISLVSSCSNDLGWTLPWSSYGEDVILNGALSRRFLSLM